MNIKVYQLLKVVGPVVPYVMQYKGDVWSITRERYMSRGNIRFKNSRGASWTTDVNWNGYMDRPDYFDHLIIDEFYAWGRGPAHC